MSQPAPTPTNDSPVSPKFLGDLTHDLEKLLRLIYPNLPAIPIASPKELIGTLVRLGKRTEETQPALDGLSTEYTIDGQTATGQEFLFGGDSRDKAAQEAREALQAELQAGDDQTHFGLLKKAAADVEQKVEAKKAEDTGTDLTSLSLDEPDQWSISWTHFEGVYERARPRLPEWAETVTVSAEGAEAATREFWPTLATYGIAYNLLILAKVDAARIDSIRAYLGSSFDAELEQLYEEERLFVIDMSLFQTVAANEVKGFERFTPATVALLAQDPDTKTYRPVAVRVSGENDQNLQIYLRSTSTDGQWIYALEAARVSITVWGIWLGHVYHWHLVTAAMQQTLDDTVPDGHPLQQLLAPQSDYLIPFDNILLLLWGSIAPPTSLSTAPQFLSLANAFAKGRKYFDDDPLNTLSRLGIDEADFTVSRPWDQYPVAGYLLEIWKATQDYVAVFVQTTFPDDQAVADDQPLQDWISAASSRRKGNIRGLPAMSSRQALEEVLTSLIFRITMHGVSRLNSAANPALTFVANFPPTLQTTAVPDPDLSTEELLAMLPKTGTIGSMVTFYFTFVFSAPYVPFIPLGGVETDLFFPGGLADPRNQALVDYRNAVIRFITAFEPEKPQQHQWPLNIET